MISKTYRFVSNPLSKGRWRSQRDAGTCLQRKLDPSFYLLKEGKYLAKVRANPQVWGGNEFARMIVTVNGIQIADFSVDAQKIDKKEYAFESRNPTSKTK